MRFDIRTANAVRLGLRQIDGFAKTDAEAIERARTHPFVSVRDLWLRSGLDAAALRRLAEADTFRSVGLDRRAALWAVRALRRVADKDDLPLLARLKLPPQEAAVALPAMSIGRQVVEDTAICACRSKAHPLAAAPSAGQNAHSYQCGIPGATRRRARLYCRSGAGAPASRQRQEHLHDLGGRNRRRQCDGLAQNLRGLSPHRDGGALCRYCRQGESGSNVIDLIAEKLEDLTSLLRGLDADFVAEEGPEAAMPRGRNFH